jgi:hypothetical protein
MIWTAEAIPAGDTNPPSQALQLEWFYMSFHKEDRAKYVKSGRRLSNKTLESVAEYFENIFNLQLADGFLAKKRKRQIEQRVRWEMRHELCKRYNEKVHLVTEQHYRGDNRHSRQDSKYHHHNYKWQDHGDSGRRDNYDKHDNNRRTRLPLIAAIRHSSHAWCTGQRASTPLRSATRIQKNNKHQLRDKKRHYKAHHKDVCYTSIDDELCLNINTPVSSEDPESASSKSKKTHEDESYHLHDTKKMKADCHVPRKSDH